MKKTILTLSFILIIFHFSYAQWSTSSGANIYNTALGYVGIGNSAPFYPLDILTNTNGTTGLNFVNSNTGSLARTRFTLNNGSTYAIIQLASPNYPTDPNSLYIAAPGVGGAFLFGTGSAERMRITPTGNLLIGQSTQVNTTYILDINGSARAKAITVNTTGADFVFEPQYILRPLSELKKYIDQNRHLPEIESAKQMQTDGLNVGDNQTKLLQKVEELTLYLIEKDEQLKLQQAQIDLLIKQVAELSKGKDK